MTPRITDWKLFRSVRNWYGKFERPISSLSLIGGFLFDAITLRRVDLFWENFWVVAHLLIVATCIIWINRKDLQMGDEKNPEKIHFWLVNILQFFFGGILSTYLVFYFRSGTLSASWPFLIFLALAFWANEALKTRYVRLSFQIGLFYLSLFAFDIFLIPVILHQIGVAVFLFSGIISLVFMGLFVLILDHFTHTKFRQNKTRVLVSVGAIFIFMNILYFKNVIPPIPLSLKDAGVYHSIAKNSSGNYVVQAEQKNWWEFFRLSESFHASGTDPIYIYSAIFSPPELNITIVHHLQYYNPTAKIWIEQGIVYLPVVGGRDSGFRTYSLQQGLAPGEYRVNVETESGQVIGTIPFIVVPPSPNVTLKTETK